MSAYLENQSGSGLSGLPHSPADAGLTRISNLQPMVSISRTLGASFRLRWIFSSALKPSDSAGEGFAQQRGGEVVQGGKTFLQELLDAECRGEFGFEPAGD